MRAAEFILEAVVGKLHIGEWSIAVDDHSFDRTKTRRISPHKTDYILRLIPTVSNEINDIELGQKFWVYCPEVDASLGFRKTEDKGLLFKTVVGDRPYDSDIPVIDILAKGN